MHFSYSSITSGSWVGRTVPRRQLLLKYFRRFSRPLRYLIFTCEFKVVSFSILYCTQSTLVVAALVSKKFTSSSDEGLNSSSPLPSDFKISFCCLSTKSWKSSRFLGGLRSLTGSGCSACAISG